MQINGFLTINQLKEIIYNHDEFVYTSDNIHHYISNKSKDLQKRILIYYVGYDKENNSISESEYSGYLLCDDKKQTVETVTSINSIITFLELSKNDILNCLEYLLKLVEKGEILYDTLDKCDISVGMLTGRLRKIKYITMQFEQYLK